jgi:hypothetical protein
MTQRWLLLSSPQRIGSYAASPMMIGSGRQLIPSFISPLQCGHTAIRDPPYALMLAILAFGCDNP